MNFPRGKNAPAAKASSEVIDLCFSSDDEGQSNKHNGILRTLPSASSSLKRAFAFGNGPTRLDRRKNKRPKPDPSGFGDPVEDNDSDVEIIEIDADTPPGKSTQQKSVLVPDDGTSKPSADSSGVAISSTSTSTGTSSRISGSCTNDDDYDDSDIEVVEPQPSAWRLVSEAAASSAGQKDDDISRVAASNSNADNSSRRGTGNLKDDRDYDGANSTTAAGNVHSDADERDEFEIVGTKGTNALVDFPHSRENCVTHPFARANTTVSREDKRKHCPNCYCYVCDIPANDCVVWDSHCMASHGNARWRIERDRVKRLGVDAATAAAPPPAPAILHRRSLHLQVGLLPRLHRSLLEPFAITLIAPTFPNNPSRPSSRPSPSSIQSRPRHLPRCSVRI